MIFKNKSYDILKYLALIGIPAIGTFWFAIATIWNLPYAQEILGTITAFDTLLGALIKVSANKYNGADFSDIPEREDNSSDD